MADNIINVIFKASMQSLISGTKEATQAVMNVGGEAFKAAAQFVRGFGSAESSTKQLTADVRQVSASLNSAGAVWETTGKNIGKIFKNSADQSKLSMNEIIRNFERGFKSGAKQSEVSLFEIIKHFKEIQNAARQAGNSMSDNINRGRNGFRLATGEVNNLKYAIMSLMSAYAGKEIIKFTIGAAFNREAIEMQYETLLKSAKAAQQRVNELTKFADVTPYEMDELLQADKILTNYKIRTMDWVKTIGDAASALQNPKEKLVEIAQYLGRISSGQTGISLERFEELGIITRARLKEMGLLFDKQNAYKGSIKDLMDAIYKELNSTYGGMMEKLAKTGTGTLSTLADSFKAFGRDIGMGALDEAKGGIKDLIDLLQQMRDNGTLSTISKNFGGVLSQIIQYFRDLLLNADEAAQKIKDFSERANMGIGDFIKMIEMALEVWISFKIALMIAPIVQGLIIVIGLLTGSIKAATVAQWLLNVAMNANPIGILVTLIGLLIFGLIRLYRTNETARKVMVTAWDAVKIAFLGFAYINLYYIALIIKEWQFFMGWIPGIGTALQKASNVVENALKGIDKQIAITKGNMQDLWNTASKGISDSSYAVNASLDSAEEAALGANKELRKQYYQNMPTSTPSAPSYKPVSGGASSSIKDTRTYSDKKIEEIQNKYDANINLTESKISLAEAQKNQGAQKTFMQSLISTLTQQAKDLFTAEGGAKTTKDRNIIEAARNKILTQILGITEKINGGINEMIGSFNAPSELAAMTNYQYSTTTNKTSSYTKTTTIEPNVEVHITVPSLKDGIDKVKSQGAAVGNAFIKGMKDELTNAFTADARRNG